MESFSAEDVDVDGHIRSGVEDLTRRFTRDGWEKEIENAKNNIQVVILSKLVEEATDWLFKDRTAAAGDLPATEISGGDSSQ